MFLYKLIETTGIQKCLLIKIDSLKKNPVENARHANLWNLTSKFTVMRDGVSLKNLGARSENECRAPLGKS
jgi:hypothetical protein